MDRIRSIALHLGAHAHRIDRGRTLTVVMIGLMLMLISSISFVLTVGSGSIPTFDQQITLDAQHSLIIHYGLSPTCAPIPNPPQHDCFWLGPERREFSVTYLSPNGVRSLVWLRLPAR